MTFVHTFYSEPLFANKFSIFSQSINNILYDYALSAVFCKKFGHNIKLFTDERGKQLLSDIPYDEVIVLDKTDSNKHFAASFKFYALQQCELSDILIDGDIIINDQEAFKVIQNSKCDVLFSFIENNQYIFENKTIEQYNSAKDYFVNLFNKMNSVNGIKYKLPTIENIEYMNTSLLRITNQNLKDEYIDQYFYHMNLMKDIDFEYTWPDIIIEQYFLKKIVEERDYSCKSIITNYPNTTKYEQDMGFSHLGSIKTKYLPVIKQFLLKNDENLYYKIQQKIKETIG